MCVWGGGRGISYFVVEQGEFEKFQILSLLPGACTQRFKLPDNGVYHMRNPEDINTNDLSLIPAEGRRIKW